MDMIIQVRNKMLTIWLLHKVYCRLLTAFISPLQVVEDDDAGKNSAALQNLRINSLATKHLTSPV